MNRFSTFAKYKNYIQKSVVDLSTINKLSEKNLNPFTLVS